MSKQRRDQPAGTGPDGFGAALTNATRMVTATGRAAVDAVLKPQAVVDTARRMAAALPAARRAGSQVLTGRIDDWRSEYAYTLGEQAFIYGFPYIYNAQIRYSWVTQPRDRTHIPYAAVNHFWHASRLLDATFRDVSCPNIDTLYSFAWVNLSDEPVILSHPDMGDRYFTFELVAITSDNFGYVGQRTTGSKAGHFALVGPGWSGDLPPDVTRIESAPSPWIVVVGRTLVADAADVTNVRALQRQYRLTPLSQWGVPHARVPQRRNVLKPVSMAEDPLGPWKTLNAMLAENPPPEHHEVLLRQFAEIGVGPGLDVEDQPVAVKKSLARVAAIGTPLLQQQILSGDWAKLVHGWRYPPPQVGRFGDDFLKRAAEQSLVGMACNDPEEAVYLVNFDDADGVRLSGAHRYQLRFAPGDLPPVDAFWSLTAYDTDLNLIPNPVDRYSIGDRTTGLVYDSDGGLTMYMQAKSPGPDKEPNWLPSTKEGEWFVVLRMYRPHPEVVDAAWHCPGITRIG